MPSAGSKRARSPDFSTKAPAPDTLPPHPRTHAMRWWTSNLADSQAASVWLGGVNIESIRAWTGTLGAEVLNRLLLLLVVLITLFFLLRDAVWIGERVLGTADRLLGDPGERLASKMVDAVRGTVTGTVVVAVSEGVLIGVAYVLAGISNPFMFTILTIVFAMLPLGAWLAFTTAGDARRRLLVVAETGRQLRTPAIPPGSNRNLRRLASLRAYWSVRRTGDHGGTADDLARMAAPAGREMKRARNSTLRLRTALSQLDSLPWSPRG
jgi:hypothetical protein